MKIFSRVFNIGVILVLSHFILQAQQPLELQLEQRGEVVVSFELAELHKLENINAYSIEPMFNGRYLAYLNADQYQDFINQAIAFIPEVPPSMLYPAKMATVKSEMNSWDAYPSYELYLEIMEAFATNYPDYCLIDTIGLSQDGRLRRGWQTRWRSRRTGMAKVKMWCLRRARRRMT